MTSETNSEDRRRGRIIDACVVLGLVLVTLLIYVQSSSFAFLNFDDDEYVSDNPIVARGLSWGGIAWAITQGHAANWHPVTWLSHMIDCSLFGLEPGRHHLMNVLIHILAALLVYFSFQALTLHRWPSAIVAAVFAWHPLHVESVAWIAERKDVLSAFFWFAGLWVYAKYVRRPVWGLYASLVILHALGIMAKPMNVTLPFVLLLLDYWPLGRYSVPTDRRLHLGRLVLEKTPLFLISVASCFVTVHVQELGKAMKSVELFPWDVRVGNAFIAYTTYIVQAIVPVRLSAFYPHAGKTWMSMEAIVAAVVLVVISIVVLRERERRPYLAIGWLWYLGTLVPVIGLVQVGAHAHADRYMYIPLVGLTLAVVWSGCDYARDNRTRRMTLVAIATVALVTFAASAFRQVGYWRTSETLFSRALSVTKDNWLAHINLGKVLADSGRYAEAQDHFAEAARIVPNYYLPYFNVGNMLVQANRMHDAEAAYLRALQLNSNHAGSHDALGRLLLHQGRLPEAAEHLKRAVELRPLYVQSRIDYGIALAQSGDVSAATRQLEAAHQLDPRSADASFNLGLAYSMQSRFPEAETCFAVAVESRPKDTEALRMLARMLLQQGKLDAAKKEFQRLLALIPSDQEAHAGVAGVDLPQNVSPSSK